MKRYTIFSFIAILVLLFASCEQETQSTYPNGELPIFRGYMQFSTEVSTRAALATHMRGKDFGVIGFQYSPTTDWGTAKSTATPMTDFFDQMVSCGSQGGVCTYDVDGTKDGDQYMLWEENKYAFFAYYPYGRDGIELSDPSLSNTPYLTYTYPWADRTIVPVYDTANDYGMYDLMTAEDIDCDGSRNVSLDFKHRLFAIEVLANNYNETQFQYVYDTTKPVWEYVTDENGKVVVGDDGKPIIKTDENGNKVQAKNEDGTPKYEILLDKNGRKVIATDADGNKIILTDPETGKPLDATTSISRLSVEISGLQYSAITIPLSKQSGEKQYISRKDPEGIKGKTVAFDIQDIPLTIPAFNDPIYDAEGKIIAGDGIPTSISKLGSSSKNGYLMFIPQDEPIKFSLWWREIEPDQSIDRTIESTVKFEPGYLYQLIVNFVGSGITVHLIKVGAWDDQPVYHTFE